MGLEDFDQGQVEEWGDFDQGGVEEQKDFGQGWVEEREDFDQGQVGDFEWEDREHYDHEGLVDYDLVSLGELDLMWEEGQA